MSRRLSVLDRLAGLLLGLALVAVGLLAVDWQAGRVLDLPGTLRTGSVSDVVTSSWWPWAASVGGVLLALLGLAWLLAHLGRGREGTTRLSSGNETGDLVVDLASVASAAAARLEATAPVTDVRGTTRKVRGATVVELRGHVAAHADTTQVLDASAACIEEVAAALDEEVSCRVLLNAPRARRSDRTDRVRI